MIKISRQKVSRNKFPIAVVAVELVTALLAVYLFYKIMGFNFDFNSRVLSFAPAAEPVLSLFFALCIALLVAMHFAVKKKLPHILQAQELAKGTIKEKAREKLAKANDPKAAALLLIEFTFVFAIVLAIVAWLDPEQELIPWGEAGVQPPISTLLNAVVALIVLAFFYYLYSFTAWYRK